MTLRDPVGLSFPRSAYVQSPEPYRRTTSTATRSEQGRYNVTRTNDPYRRATTQPNRGTGTQHRKAPSQGNSTPSRSFDGGSRSTPSHNTGGGSGGGGGTRTTRNLGNQFELPAIFYAVVVLLIVLKQTLLIDVLAAWAFVAGRVVHTGVQTLTSNVRLRGMVFMINFLGLAVLVAHLALVALSAP